MSEYDTDVLLWSEHQASLLRRRAAGELVNDAELDWPNIAEEIESLGKSVARGARQPRFEHSCPSYQTGSLTSRRTSRWLAQHHP
jgi:hypothetical protein